MTAFDSSRPLLLALDTATATASLAVFDTAAEQVLAESTWQAGRDHTAQVLVETMQALARVSQGLRRVGGLAVASGPGSFTGVRVALSAAKGMAAGLGVPLWAVSTLDVVAHGAGPTPWPVRATVDAGRNRVATALYVNGTCLEPIRGVSMAEVASLVTQPTVVIGDLSAELRATLRAGGVARVVSPAGSLRRAGYLAELAWQAFQRGESGDPSLADAVYLPPR